MSANRWMMVAAIIASLQVSACGQKDTGYKYDPPFHTEQIEGRDVKSVTFTAKAAERTGIELGRVTEERVSRQRTFSGQVVAQGAPSNGFLVRVGDDGDTDGVAANEPAHISPLVNQRENPGGWIGYPVEGQRRHYAVRNADERPSPGEAVAVDLTLSASQRKVVPYASIIYDAHGATWVYTNPHPLVYVREPINVDYIEGDKAVLFEGPPTGMVVVTVGAAEVFGAEFGMGH